MKNSPPRSWPGPTRTATRALLFGNPTMHVTWVGSTATGAPSTTANGNLALSVGAADAVKPSLPPSRTAGQTVDVASDLDLWREGPTYCCVKPDTHPIPGLVSAIDYRALAWGQFESGWIARTSSAAQQYWSASRSLDRQRRQVGLVRANI